MGLVLQALYKTMAMPGNLGWMKCILSLAMKSVRRPILLFRNRKLIMHITITSNGELNFGASTYWCERPFLAFQSYCTIPMQYILQDCAPEPPIGALRCQLYTELKMFFPRPHPVRPSSRACTKHLLSLKTSPRIPGSLLYPVRAISDETCPFLEFPAPKQAF